jgi:cyclopropane fatty-acyl-phospholipid synthase-like methyltransferase
MNVKPISLLLSIWVTIISGQMLATTKWSISDPHKEGWTEIAKAKQYFHNSDLQRQWADAALAKISFDAKDNVLDFGCGDGKISAAIHHRVASVTGVDLSEAMIDFAQRKYPQAQFSRLEFKLAKSTDFSDLTFAGKFDKVVSFCVFHLVKSPVATLRNIRTHMQKGGQFLWVIPSISDENKFVQAALPTLHRFKISLPGNQPMKDNDNIRLPKETAGILTKAGFEVLSVEHKVERYYFYDDAEFLQWAKGTISANWGISNTIEDSFYQNFITEYLTLDPAARTKNGSFAPQMSHLVAIAKNPG